MIAAGSACVINFRRALSVRSDCFTALISILGLTP
jgi:hypothetical protein